MPGKSVIGNGKANIPLWLLSLPLGGLNKSYAGPTGPVEVKLPPHAGLVLGCIGNNTQEYSPKILAVTGYCKDSSVFYFCKENETPVKTITDPDEVLNQPSLDWHRVYSGCKVHLGCEDGGNFGADIGPCGVKFAWSCDDGNPTVDYEPGCGRRS